MSQQAARNIPVIMGNTARELRAPLVDPLIGSPSQAPEKVKKVRAPLRLVVNPPKRSSRSLVVILFMVVVTAMAIVLVMSISVSKGQYELVGLKNQQSDLYKVNQSMRQDIAAKQAPQELVAQASALGMVPASSMGQIDVRTKQVSGSPVPASADTKGLVVIPPALIDTPTAPVAVEPETPAVKDAAATSNPAPAEKAAPAPAAVPAPELNGGTIPAPLEKGD